jgi:hypothetical protein
MKSTNYLRVKKLMFVPCIIRCSRNDQQYAQNCTTDLFYIPAPTCFGIIRELLDPSELHENTDRLVVYHIMLVSGLCAVGNTTLRHAGHLTNIITIHLLHRFYLHHTPPYKELKNYTRAPWKCPKTAETFRSTKLNVWLKGINQIYLLFLLRICMTGECCQNLLYYLDLGVTQYLTFYRSHFHLIVQTVWIILYKA